MQARSFILFLLVFTTSINYAQKSVRLAGTVQAGLLEGEKGSALQLGFMGGLTKKTWTASVGTGLDYYGVRSIPLYLNIQKNLVDKPQTPFAYIGGGYHFTWLSDNSVIDWPWWTKPETKGGLYYHAGIGYQLPAMKKAALFFAAGYSYKQYQQEQTQQVYCLIAPCPEYKEKLEYRLRRLSITTGLRF